VAIHSGLKPLVSFFSDGVLLDEFVGLSISIHGVKSDAPVNQLQQRRVWRLIVIVPLLISVVRMRETADSRLPAYQKTVPWNQEEKILGKL